MKTLKYVVLCVVLLGATLYSYNVMQTEPPQLTGADQYLDQTNRYFDSLDFYKWGLPAPKYAQDIIRWEWSPWLKLTGHGRASMKLDIFAKLYPTHVTNRVCTAFETAPQARCHVSFTFIGLATNTKIYEEFTFNDAGEITFIEAWSDTHEVSEMARLDTLPRLSKNRDLADLPERMKHPIYYWFRELVGWL